MKKISLLLALVAAFAWSADAQKLEMQSSTKLYGYKNADGAWQIAPQFAYAFEFQGHFKRFAVVNGFFAPPPPPQSGCTRRNGASAHIFPWSPVRRAGAAPPCSAPGPA